MIKGFIINMDRVPKVENPFAHSPNKSVERWTDMTKKALEANRWCLGFFHPLINTVLSPGGTLTQQVQGSSSGGGVVVTTAAQPVRSYQGPVNAAARATLPERGPGYVHTSGPARRAGHPLLIKVIQWVAAQFAAKYPNHLLNIRDLDAPSGHKSHKKGVDVDVWLPTINGDHRTPISYKDKRYSREKTQYLIDLFMNNPYAEIEYIFFNDTAIRGHVGQTGGVIQSEPNHDDHLHIRIRLPGVNK
jgi:murein endopeptidase